MSGPTPHVVVVGGGPAGAATAHALRKEGVGPVLVLEASDHTSFRIGESLPPDGRLVLEHLGILPAFLGEQHDPCLGSCSIWGDPRIGYNDFLLNPNGTGWHLDRRRFDAFLLDQAESAGVEVQRHHRAIACSATEAGAVLTVIGPNANDREKTISCRWVIDATGGRARVARMLGQTPVLDDTLVCLSAVVPMEDITPVNSLTRLEAVAEGWWYAARLPGKRLILALTTDAPTLSTAGLDAPEAWLAALRQTTLLAPLRKHWDDIAETLTVRRDPILSGRLPQVNGPSWFALGDAAARMDPLFSEGLHKAMSNGVALAQVLAGLERGKTEMAAAWAPHITARHDHYLRERQRFYQLEGRWPDAPFWMARRAATANAIQGADETERRDEFVD